MANPPVASGPSPAERARTVLGQAPTLTIEVDGQAETVDVRAVLADGAVLVLLPTAAPICARVAAGPALGLLHGARLGPLPVADRVLDTVSLGGRVHLVDADDLGAALDELGRAYPGRLAEVVLRPDAATLLQVTVGQLWLGELPVDLEDYRRAVSDPLARDSDEVVTHLLQDHVPELRQLAHLLDPALLRDARAIAPVCVDRYGLTFRVLGEHGVMLARLDYPAPLRGPAELPAAMWELQRRAAQVTGCPCHCGRAGGPG